MNWNLFVGASILVAGLLVKVGAPLPAVLLGIGLAALWNWKRPRGTSAGPSARR
jgi:hypothetical protein